jgi:hypothetical protein
MKRVRIRIGQMMVQHPSMTTAEGARLGRMVESHLEKLIVASGVPSARNIGTAHEPARLSCGAATSHSETAMAIARGIHQGLSSKK